MMHQTNRWTRGAARLGAVVLAAGAGLLIGVSVRDAGANRDEFPPAVAGEEGSEARGTKAINAAGGGPLAPERHMGTVAGQLQRDLEIATAVTRWLYWLEAIERAGLSDLPGLVRLADGEAVLLRMIGQRWMELDPRNLFDWLVVQERTPGSPATGTLESLLRDEWLKKDPDALIRALEETPNFGKERSWRSLVAAKMLEVDVERGLQLMHEWHIEDFGPGMTGVAKWAARNPRHAAEFALAHPAGYASGLVVETIGREWAKQDPAGALEFASGAPDPGGLKEVLAGAALKAWTEGDLAKAGEWVAQADVATRNRLSPHLVEAWARSDPAHALVWSEDNLEGTALNQAVRGVLRSSAEQDVAAAGRLVLAIQEESTRAEGAVAVAEKWLPEASSGESTNPNMLEWLEQLDPVSTRKVLRELHWRWAARDPESMADFLQKLNDPQVSEEVYGTLTMNLARKDPVGAIEWSEKLPENYREDVGNMAFNAWRNLQPQTAMEWLDKLPADDGRKREFFENTVTQLARYERGVLEQFEAMAPHHRAAAREIVQSLQIEPARKTRVLEALEAP